MVTKDIRDAMEAEQEQLLQALLKLSGPPPGFSKEALAVAAGSLWTKRCHTVSRCYPHLSSSLGSTFNLQFAHYTQNAAPLIVENPALDGFQFGTWLIVHGHHLSDNVRLELLAFRLHRHFDGSPRRFHILCCILPESGRFFVGTNLFGRILMNCFGRA